MARHFLDQGPSGCQDHLLLGILRWEFIKENKKTRFRPRKRSEKKKKKKERKHARDQESEKENKEKR